MASKFTDFLISFGDDPSLVQAFELNPRAVMANAGLTQAEQNMILNRDVQGIRRHLLTDSGIAQAMGLPPGSPTPKVILTCIFMSPKP